MSLNVISADLHLVSASVDLQRDDVGSFNRLCLSLPLDGAGVLFSWSDDDCMEPKLEPVPTEPVRMLSLRLVVLLFCEIKL